MIGLPPSRALAIALVALAATGCARPTVTPQPTATITPTKSPTPTATSMWSPTPIASATSTTTPSPAPLPTPWPLDASLPVVMTVEEAESEVLSWAIPEREARIERSAYVSSADFQAAMSSEELEDAWPGLDDTPYGMAFQLQEILPASGWLIMVEGSQRGIDLLGFGHRRSPDGLAGNVVPPNLCEPAPRDYRLKFTAFFDPTTGLYLGHNGADQVLSSIPESVWQLAQARVRPVHEVTPTLTPSPPPTQTAIPTADLASTLTATSTSTPRPTPTEPFPVDATSVPLGAGEVPQAVIGTARVLPWVAGGQWTYLATRVEDMVHWSTFTVTETVASAQRLSPTTMEVRLDYGEPGWTPWAAGMDLKNYLRPDGFYSDRWWTGQNHPAVVFRLPMAAGGRVDEFWYVDKVESVTVPAGHFEDCYVMIENAGARNLFAHWLCPGVGFVRHELPSCTSDGSGYTVYELTNYNIPPIIPLP